MSKVSRIVVFGGAALEIDRVTGDAYVKEPYYNYLRDLGSHGVPVVFFLLWLGGLTLAVSGSLID